VDIPLLEQVKIQAQVLVPLVKTLQVELGKERRQRHRPNGARRPVSHVWREVVAGGGSTYSWGEDGFSLR
jgi:hypothetical protein